MKIYHGTTESVAKLAVSEGLKTRKSSGSKGNWRHTVDSADDRVYLSTAYAGYFALSAVCEAMANDGGSEERWGIIEVDTDLLTESKLLPDEDFLEQASRHQAIPDEGEEGTLFAPLRAANCQPPEDRMKARTTFFRDHAPYFFGHLWEDSLKFLGNCCYHGDIPVKAITRVSLFDPKTNPDMNMAVDPTISLMNYQILGHRYREITRWLAGYEDIDSKAFSLPFVSDPDVAIDVVDEALKKVAEQRDYWENRVLSNRVGIEVIKKLELL